MNADFNAFLDDLDATPLPVSAKADTRQKFPCPSCAGTGRYVGHRVHQEKSECFACRGKGYFLTDPRKLAANRQKAKVKKADAMADFRAEHADLIKSITGMADWNDFARSLENHLVQGKVWSPNQIAAAQRMLAKMEANRAAKEAERVKAEAAAPVLDLKVIRDLFNGVVAKGYKKPTYRAEGLVISLAAATGRNPGALYVKAVEDDAYLGKIVGTKFHGTKNADATLVTLQVIAQDPLAAALRHGQRTGQCSCCGRELTNHTSIDLGIGPICREKWGL